LEVAYCIEEFPSRQTQWHPITAASASPLPPAHTRYYCPSYKGRDITQGCLRDSATLKKGLNGARAIIIGVYADAEAAEIIIIIIIRRFITAFKRAPQLYLS
jgi:hypothetical protein